MPTRGDAERRDLIAAAVRWLAENGGETPPEFVEVMFGRAAWEDLAPLPPSALGALARDAWAHLATRTVGGHDVRVASPDLPGLGRDITVVEVVNDDMPFLVDSAMAELADRGLPIRLVVHPILAMERDAAGARTGFAGDANRLEGGAAGRESLIHIHIDPIDDEDRRQALAEALGQVFDAVRLATGDWQDMRGRLAGAIATLRETPPPLPADEIAEAAAFLQWLVDDNFTFLGAREYTLVPDDEGGRLEAVEGTGLGILLDPEVKLLRRGTQYVAMTQEIRAYLMQPVPLIVTKASVRAKVHRRAHMDYIGVKLFDDAGRLTGELRFVGLFTSTAYTRSARNIPLLRRKVDQVLRRAGLAAGSHSGKALVNILEGYPRDDLFQVDVDTLYDFALEILSLYERPRVRALPRADRFDRFVSVIVFIPRDKYDSDVRARVGAYLAEAFDGHVSAFSPAFPEVALVRVHYIIGRTSGATPQIDRAELEAGIEARVQTWPDHLRTALAGLHAGPRGRMLAERYAGAFSVAYQDMHAPEAAAADIGLIDALGEGRPIAIDMVQRGDEPRTRVHLRVLSRGAPLALSERVPMLENMGFRVINERSYRIEPAGEPTPPVVWLHDMTLEAADGRPLDFDARDERLEATFMAVVRGRAENDGYNALTLAGGIAWRDIALLRAVSRFQQQAQAPFSQDYMWRVATRHAGIVARVVELFHARFDPRRPGGEARAAAEAEILAAIEADLANVASLDEDRILRRFVNVVQAAVRTNFFRLGRDGQPAATISFKLESRKVEGLPAPRPLYEIFVCSPRVEGIHLRFGKVARGGIRWSDRRDDYRTEVLGLVKAQQVKNAVIVPVGAKGGFLPKQLPSGPREAVLAEGLETYRIFIDALLDLTDDLDGGAVVHPRDVVRHDGDDPYLVVAADKGTATYSDTANALAEARGFWLGDAFASGGSVGYDHKKMGITARGGWEAVKRHFREMDVDIQNTPFTAAGVGDMSGDVFGNGMLLSKCTRLVAAFDHRDIFIDPDPDPATGWQERKRLFDLPRSSWQDYDTALISRGGGVYPRSAKSIALSQEACAVLGLEKSSATPQEVMTAILKAPVDLLWFGGIGTYVRASAESDEAAGDRANDAIRVTGRALRCKVVGEGANLGMTQLGRVEYAMAGGRINTDAIDNSAGVNSSDMEVNIKIGLAIPVKDGRLAVEARNALLASMTDEVAGLVLRNNYQQTLAVSLAERRAAENLGFDRRLMQALEARRLLDRAVEFLPDDAALAERARAGRGLTRPEIAVLVAYAKIVLFDDIVGSDVPDDPYLGRELFRYFPDALCERFPDALEHHRLRREIIATMLANSIVNRGGPAIAVRLADQTGGDIGRIAAAFAAVRDSFRMVEINSAIDALDGKVPGRVQLDLYAEVQDLLISQIVWFLRNVDLVGRLEDVVGRFRAGVDAVRASLDDTLGEEALADRAGRAAARREAGVPDELALWLASLPALAGGPDAVLVAETTGRPIAEAARTLFAVEGYFRLGPVLAAAAGIDATDYYERLALERASGETVEATRAIAAAVSAGGAAGPEAVDAWAEAHPEAGRVRRAIEEIAASGLTVAKFTVAASLLTDLVRR